MFLKLSSSVTFKQVGLKISSKSQNNFKSSQILHIGSLPALQQHTDPDGSCIQMDAVCCSALSCWNMQRLPWKNCCLDGTYSKTSMCSSALMEPVPDVSAAPIRDGLRFFMRSSGVHISSTPLSMCVHVRCRTEAALTPLRGEPKRTRGTSGEGLCSCNSFNFSFIPFEKHFEFAVCMKGEWVSSEEMEGLQSLTELKVVRGENGGFCWKLGVSGRMEGAHVDGRTHVSLQP